MEPKPNVFLIGGCRSGTTSLSRYLGTHPNVFWSTPKGPGYFAFDFENYRYMKTMDEYHRCFEGANDGHQAVCEGSTWYLYSKEAVPRILDYNPDARFMVILRNPLEQVPSFHNILYTQGNEDVADFERAWGLQDRRRAGCDIPPTCREPLFLHYGDVARFGAQLARLFKHVDRDRVKILIYDDYMADPARCYGEVLDFLGVPGDGQTEFPITMPNQRVRSRLLARIAHHPSRLRVGAANAVKKALGIERIGFSDWVERLNSRVAERDALSPRMQTRLCEYFRDDIDHLSALIDRDLSHWYRV